MAFTSLAAAANPHFECRGSGWALTLSGLHEQFVFPAPTQMDIPHQTSAEGAEWPRAYTLIGDRDTAIVVLHDRACEGGTHDVQVLTQRAQSPILLDGCCTQVAP